MPPFLADPPQWMYFVLGGLLVLTGAIAAKRSFTRAAPACSDQKAWPRRVIAPRRIARRGFPQNEQVFAVPPR